MLVVFYGTRNQRLTLRLVFSVGFLDTLTVYEISNQMEKISSWETLTFLCLILTPCKTGLGLVEAWDWVEFMYMLKTISFILGAFEAKKFIIYSKEKPIKEFLPENLFLYQKARDVVFYFGASAQFNLFRSTSTFNSKKPTSRLCTEEY